MTEQRMSLEVGRGFMSSCPKMEAEVRYVCAQEELIIERKLRRWNIFTQCVAIVFNLACKSLLHISIKNISEHSTGGTGRSI